MWLVVGVKSICDEDSFKHKNQKRIKLLNCFEGQEEAETNKVKGKIRTGDWELLKRQRSPLDHEICHSSMDEKKDL